MFRNHTSTLLLAPQTSRRLAASVVPASSSTSSSSAASLLLAANKQQQQPKQRRPANLAPTWFANQTPAESSSNLKFIAISMRQVEIKSSDVTARASDRLSANSSSSKNLFRCNDGCASPAPVVISEFDDLRNDSSNTLRYITNLVSNTETDTTFGDPSGGEALDCTQPIRLPGRRRGPWGKPFFGKVFHQPRNFAYQTSVYWSRKFRMKKHRYRKRWQKRRYKVAALANMPFAKRLRVNMIPKLQQGKKRKAGGSGAESTLDLDFSPDAQAAAADAATGKAKASGTKKRYRPTSKYQV